MWTRTLSNRRASAAVASWLASSTTMARSTMSWASTSRQVFSIVRAALYAGITTTTFWPAITRLRARIVRRQRQIAHRMQAGRRGEDLRDGIDDDRGGRDVAVDAAGELHRQARRAFDVDGIVRFGRAEIRFHVKTDHGFA